MFGYTKLKYRIESLELQAKYPSKYNVGDKPLDDHIITNKEFIVKRFAGEVLSCDWYYSITNTKTGSTSYRRL